MDLRELSVTHGDFYVPAFQIKASGDDLVRTLEIGVQGVDVDLALSTMGRFSFTVVGCWDAERREFRSGQGRPVLDVLRFGASVEIAVGYGDFRKLTRLISGIVTEISTSFSDSGPPELSVSGYDPLFGMTLGKGSRNWHDVSDSDVISKLASEYNLSAVIQNTSEKHAQIEQNQESDFDLLKKLTERNHFEFFVDGDKTLRCGPPRDGAGEAVSLSWGRTLFSFKPEANLANQVAEVEVYGWNVEKKEAFVGKASAGDASGKEADRKSGGELLRSAIGRAPVLRIRQPVFSEAEAKRRAQAILNENAKKFLTGEAECVGLPELLPDTNVRLEDLGPRFSKTYYVQQATHRMDAGGYRTRFKVKEVSL
jgi:phage protein D